MSKFSKQPKRAAGWLFGKFPWYGKPLTPVVVLALAVYLLGWVLS